MPPVIPFVAAALVSVGVPAGVAATVATIAVNLAVGLASSFALSAISKALTGKPKNRGPLGSFSDRTQAVRQAITVRRVIYGEVRVSGPFTFIHSTDNNQYINLLITLSGHPVESIGAVYFNDELIPTDWDSHATGKYQGHVIIVRGLGTTAGDSSLMSWMTAQCPGVWTSAHRQSGCAKLYVQLKYNPTLFPNGIPNISCIVKGKQVYDPRTSTTQWTDNAALCVRDYLTDTTYGLGESSINDTAAIAAANVCDESVTVVARTGTFSVFQIPTPTAAPVVRHSHVPRPFVVFPGGTFKYAVSYVDATGETLPGPETSFTGTTFGSGPLVTYGIAISGIPKGPTGTTARRIYRTESGGSQLKLLTTISDNSTTTYTDTTQDASLGANALTVSTTLVHDDIRVTGSNIVLTTGSPVALSTTGTLPAGLSAATYYAIDTGNESYYLATSRANALAGTYVNITGLGSGTHSISASSETRYKCNGIIDTDTRPKDAIGSLLTSMMGSVAYQGGEWNIYAGAYRAPTVTLDEDDLDGPIKVTTRLSRSQTFNAVKGVYVNPLDFYQPADFPPVTNATYLSQDQGERIGRI